MRIIVAAAGPQTKWGGHLGVRSHFAPVRGHLGYDQPVLPLLELTLAQVTAYLQDVVLTVPAGEPGPYEALARAYGVRTHRAEQSARNEFESSRPVWADHGRTVLLLGDVYYTDEALAAILDDQADGVRVFGREYGSRLTGSPWGEIFAVSWTDSADMGRLVDEVARAQDTGRVGDVRPGWLLLRLLQETPLREHRVFPPWWVEIDDATDDLDFPADYRRHPATRGLA